MVCMARKVTYRTIVISANHSDWIRFRLGSGVDCVNFGKISVMVASVTRTARKARAPRKLNSCSL